MTAIICTHCGKPIEETDDLLSIDNERETPDLVHFDCMAPMMHGREISERLARSVADQVRRLCGDAGR